MVLVAVELSVMGLYLLPVLNAAAPNPPQTIISLLSVQTAVCRARVSGALVSVVAVHQSWSSALRAVSSPAPEPAQARTTLQRVVWNRSGLPRPLAIASGYTADQYIDYVIARQAYECIYKSGIYSGTTTLIAFASCCSGSCVNCLGPTRTTRARSSRWKKAFGHARTQPDQVSALTNDR